jgi:hypothetical protein
MVHAERVMVNVFVNQDSPDVNARSVLPASLNSPSVNDVAVTLVQPPMRSVSLEVANVSANQLMLVIVVTNVISLTMDTLLVIIVNVHTLDRNQVCVTLAPVGVHAKPTTNKRNAMHARPVTMDTPPVFRVNVTRKVPVRRNVTLRVDSVVVNRCIPVIVVIVVYLVSMVSPIVNDVIVTRQVQ